MNLNELNQLPPEQFMEIVSVSMGSAMWQKKMEKKRPFSSMPDLFTASNSVWYRECNPDDWLEAFQHHPMIGDLKSIADKFSSTEKFAGKEQEAVAEADSEVIGKLYSANQEYLKKNGFIFIVFASGKSATEMLSLLQSRLHNTKDDELRIAMGEQQKITQSRLKKLLSAEINSETKVSQLTTHILDTSAGKPASHILTRLKGPDGIISEGITNKDGRVANLLPDEYLLDPGNYSLRFETKPYFDLRGSESFYPFVEINFSIINNEHYHVPLLINPFGYSTYRGS